uniref:Uncharacterized protein n=1 Tax=Oryza rufipogon TaxID=4529 RepID=A0A0E0PKH4_ORYRU
MGLTQPPLTSSSPPHAVEPSSPLRQAAAPPRAVEPSSPLASSSPPHRSRRRPGGRHAERRDKGEGMRERVRDI